MSHLLSQLALLLALFPALPASAGEAPRTARVAFEIPPGSRLLVDGEDYRDRRTFEDAKLAPGQVGQLEVEVRLPDGGMHRRTVLYERGWQVHLTVPPANIVRPEIVPQTGHADPINSLQYSPDGSQLLTGSGDRSAILWDAATGRKLRTYTGKHSDFVSGVRFSPDARLIYTASLDKTIVVWDRLTGKDIRVIGPAKSPILSLALSANGQILAAGCRDGQVQLWSSEGKSLGEISAQQGPVYTVTLSRTAKYVVSGGADRAATFWLVDGLRKVGSFPGHDGEVLGLALSENGKLLGTVGTDGKAVIWDITRGQKVQTLLHRNVATGIAFSPDGKYMATSCADHTARLWDVVSGKEVHVLRGHLDKVLSVAWRPDGQQLATGSWDTTAGTWDVTSGERLLTLGKLADRPWTLSFSRDGKKFFIGTGDRGGVIWNPTTRQLQHFGGHTLRTIAVDFGPGDRQLLTGSDDGTAILWDLTTGKMLHTLRAHKDWVMGVNFSPAGDLGLTNSRDGLAIIWDLKSGDVVRKLDARTIDPNAGAAWDARWDPKGERIITVHGEVSVTTTRPGIAILWNAHTGQPIRTFKGHTKQVVNGVLSPDGKVLATSSLDKTIIIWDVDKGTKLRTLTGHTRVAGGLKFLAGGEQLLSCSGDGTIRWWDLQTGKELRILGRKDATDSLLRGHTGPVDMIDVHPSERFLLSGGGDGEVHFWDLATGETLALLITLRQGRDWLVVTPEGLFDGSPSGRNNVNVRLDRKLDVVPLGRFLNDFFSFGLLETVWKGQRPLPRVALDKSRPPLLRLLSPVAGVAPTREVIVEVEVTDQGSGVDGPHLYHQGVRVAGPWKMIDKKGTITRQQRKVALVQGPNRIQVRAASLDRVIESEPVQTSLELLQQQPKGRAHVVVVGVSKYADQNLKLRYAANDAHALAQLFKARGAALYSGVELHELLDGLATGANIRAVLKDVAARADEQDTLVLLLAGHGLARGKEYWFLPQDFRTEGGELDERLSQSALSATMVGQELAKIKARRRVLVLDTCQSGAASTQLLRFKQAQGDALVRFHHLEGGAFIAAAAANQDAKEHEKLGHGVLTYTLLAALGGVDTGALKDQPIPIRPPRTTARVLEWIGYATNHVPDLMQQLFRQELYPEFDATGVNFDVLPVGKK